MTATTTGIQVLCPCCNEPAASISYNLFDCSWTCHECDNAFDDEEIYEKVAELRSQIAVWEKLQAWASGMPQMPSA